MSAYTVHVFHLFLAFYHILKELRQLHFNGKEIQWPAVEQVLKEVAPPSDEFIKQVKEQLTNYTERFPVTVTQALLRNPAVTGHGQLPVSILPTRNAPRKPK